MVLLSVRLALGARSHVAENILAGGAVGKLSVEGLSHNAIRSAMAGVPWTTSNKQMNDWLRCKIEDEALLMRFGHIAILERLEIATQLIKREHSLTNVTAYFAGGINKSLNRIGGGCRSHPYAGGGSRDSSSASRPLPSPVRAGHITSSGGFTPVSSPGQSSSSVSVGGQVATRSTPQTPGSLPASASSVPAMGASLVVSGAKRRQIVTIDMLRETM